LYDDREGGLHDLVAPSYADCVEAARCVLRERHIDHAPADRQLSKVQVMQVRLVDVEPKRKRVIPEPGSGNCDLNLVAWRVRAPVSRDRDLRTCLRERKHQNQEERMHDVVTGPHVG